MKNHLKSMTQAEIGAVLKELGQPAFRAKQVFSWLHKGVRSYDEMSNLPKALREALADKYPLHIREPHQSHPLNKAPNSDRSARSQSQSFHVGNLPACCKEVPEY